MYEFTEEDKDFIIECTKSLIVKNLTKDNETNGCIALHSKTTNEKLKELDTPDNWKLYRRDLSDPQQVLLIFELIPITIKDETEA